MTSAHFSFHQGQTLTTKDVSGEWVARCPANLDLEVGRVIYSYAQISTITHALKESQPGWSRQSFEDRRSAVVQALLQLLQHKNEWFQIAQQELGRTDIDLESEWTQFEQWVGYFKSAFTLQDAELRRARGVVAVVGSYVWPLVYSFQSACLALVGGNAVILKPSEKATLSSLKAASWMAEQPEIQKVFSVLVGDRELGRRLVCHEEVQAVAFYGSFEVGMRVKQDTLSQPSKEVLLYLGAKNPSIVLGSPPDQVYETLIRDAFLTTGQHCRSVSQIWVQASEFETFTERFHQASKKFKIGEAIDAAYAGPLIDPSMVDRYLKFTGISEREGANILMRGKLLELKHKGNYVTPTLAAYEKMSAEQLRKSVTLQTEILSPHVSILKFESEEELSAWSQELTHGLAASVWSSDPVQSTRIAKQLPFGTVAINRGVLSWDPAQSFQALKKSGNHAYQGPKSAEQFTILRA